MDQTASSISRRTLLKSSGAAVAAAGVSSSLMTNLYAGQDSTLNIALVGCGGRGTGAAANAMSNKSGPTKLVAMADVFSDRLANSYDGLKGQYEKQVDIPESQKFIGFDGYKHAMDALRPGDIVILATPPAFRWVQFKYAIERGLNVFMEKPVTVDGPSSRRMLELYEESKKKNLKVGVGLMCRHCLARKELFDRIQAGEIGDLVLLRAYRMAGPTGNAFTPPKPEGVSELEYQIRNFHGFLWASGGGFSDFLIHNIDEACWMKNDWPVEAKGSGGRHFRDNYIDQNFDHYSVEYTFKDGTKLYLEGRTMPNCHNEFATYVHGTKGSAIVSTASHAPAKSRIFSGQSFTKQDQVWAYPPEEPSPYQLEWDDLVKAILENTEYNEVKRGVEASLVTAMGRMAAHTGQVITYDDMLNCEHEFAPDLESLTLDSPAPILADANGKYPVPQPGITTTREY